MAKEPTKIKIRVKLPDKKKPEEKKTPGEDTRLREWPWRIMRGPETSGSELRIEFWDAMTFLNPQTQQLELHSMYQNSDVEFDSTVTTGREKTVVFKHNGMNNADATTLEDHYVANSVPVADKAQLNKMDDSDYDRDEVLPTGVYYPNLEATLKNSAGETIDATDYISYYEGTSLGTVLSSAEKLTYDWLAPKMISGHLSVAEKTSKSIVTHSHGVINYSGWDGSLFLAGCNDTVEGIFWNPFDTSDTTNYKITSVPKYDCAPEDVVSDDVLKIPSSAITVARVFMTRRRVHFSARYDDAGTEKNYGLYDYWPSSFRIPACRKLGRWELTADYPQSSWESEYPSIPFNEDNTHAIWEWVADSKTTNGLYIHNIKSAILNIGFVLGIPGWKTYRTEDDDFTAFRHTIITAKNGMDRMGSDTEFEYVDWAHPATGGGDAVETLYNWTSSMPDGKCPWENSTGLVKAMLDGVEVVSRTAYKYSDSDFLTDDKNKILDLKASFLAHPFFAEIDGGFTPQGTLRSWGLSIAGQKAEELAAVIENGHGSTFWVWRKTDEVITNVLSATNDGRFSIDTSDGTPSWPGDPLLSTEFSKMDNMAFPDAAITDNNWGPFNWTDLYSREGRLDLDWGSYQNKAKPASSKSFRQYSSWGCYWTGLHEEGCYGWPGTDENGDSLSSWNWGNAINDFPPEHPDGKTEWRSVWPVWFTGDTTPRWMTNEECTTENYEILTVDIQRELFDLGSDFWLVLWYPEHMNA